MNIFSCPVELHKEKLIKLLEYHTTYCYVATRSLDLNQTRQVIMDGLSGHLTCNEVVAAMFGSRHVIGWQHIRCVLNPLLFSLIRKAVDVALI